MPFLTAHTVPSGRACGPKAVFPPAGMGRRSELRDAAGRVEPQRPFSNLTSSDCTWPSRMVTGTRCSANFSCQTRSW